MFKIFVVCSLLTACYSQPTPLVSSSTPPNTVDKPDPPAVYRLKVGYFKTSDGLKIQNGLLYDSAYNSTCFESKDSSGTTRCFPNVVGYQPRTYSDRNCRNQVLYVPSGSELVGTYTGTSLSLNRVGIKITVLPGLFRMNDQSVCTQMSPDQDHEVFTVGEDLTSTLETLETVYE